ncbi:C-type mannose receptor 2-like [Anabas testudineus]|uniref:C-type mannose receptor 2-like n=1 Tax=Anabas testudineus TaxID=64144 RepID=UPI000E4568BB|nr:C-type mannose receptor 2-like [Anabas testudineus]
MMIPVVFMLCSGFFHFTLASNRLRFFSFLQNDVQWITGKNGCITMNRSLVTLYDEDDAYFVHKFTESQLGDNKRSWLGLHMSQHNVSTWSSSGHFTSSLPDVDVTNGQQICEAIENNTRKGFNCSDRKPFMCYRGSNYTMIEKETKNWCQAQHYCRKHFTDLVNVSNETQNDVIEKGKNESFWIGVMHDEWEWEDKSCSTYRKWSDNKHNVNSEETCTQELNLKLYKNKCENCSPMLCSTGTVRIKVIKENLTWEQAFDYCKANHSRLLQIEDAKDQEAVEQWLNISNAGDTFWIGLRQSRLFGFWIWSDKTVAYNNWKNSTIPQMPMSNNCGVIKKDNQTWSWSDENCFLPFPFLCEEEISYMKYKGYQ